MSICVSSTQLVHSMQEFRTTALRHASVLVQHTQDQAVLDQERMDLKSQKEAAAANEGTETHCQLAILHVTSSVRFHQLYSMPVSFPCQLCCQCNHVKVVYIHCLKAGLPL